MEHEVWRERWETGRTAWHQADVHPVLAERWGTLGLPADATVFVPLCGASIDMVWLAERGHHVVGSELSEIAIRKFFEHVGLDPEARSVGELTRFAAGPYELWCGDHFELTADALAGAAAVYDRASLVALPPETRRRYAAHLAEVLAPGAVSFLLTFVYDQAEMDGPPFSVPATEVDELFGAAFDVARHVDDEVADRNADLVARGLSGVSEELHVLRRRP